MLYVNSTYDPITSFEKDHSVDQELACNFIKKETV